ncbi:BLUF domain-containing protein [Sphingomonadaceae bacterium]|nr:BLUF domain-containing protein [Sphingomonadaceae bacterium]
MMTSPEPTPFSRLLYTSKQVTGRPKRKGADIDELVELSARRNASCGLTGVLLQMEDTFIQALEGPPEALYETFERICCDSRHENINLIELSPVNERLFDQWDMAKLSYDQGTDITFRKGIENICFLINVNSKDVVMELRRHLEMVSGNLVRGAVH